MLIYLVRILVILTIFYPGDLFAMLEANGEDIKLSKKSFLISRAPYDENNKSNGVLTLCFESSKGSNHAALVFEIFHSVLPDDVSVHMIHYGSEDHCCCGGNRQPIIDTVDTTLINVYRGIRVDQLTAQKQYRPAEYIRYASWILPNEDLIRGYTLACTDDTDHKLNQALYNSYSSIAYVQRIMQAVGLTHVDFGWWRETPNNLKNLVDQYITPRPDRTEYKEITLQII